MVESAAKPTSLTRKLSNWKIAKTGFNAQYFCANSDQVETPQRLSFLGTIALLSGKKYTCGGRFSCNVSSFFTENFFCARA